MTNKNVFGGLKFINATQKESNETIPCMRTMTFVMENKRAGFGSELNNALFVVIYAEITNRTFRFDSRPWINGNWDDFFYFPYWNCDLPANETLVAMKGVRIEDDRHPHLFTGRHIGWSGLRTQNEPFGNFCVKAMALRKIWKLKQVIQEQILQHMRNLSLLASESESCTHLQQDGTLCNLENVKTVPFIGALVRRGDKHIEAKEQPIEKYIDLLDRVGCRLLLVTAGISSALAKECLSNLSHAANYSYRYSLSFPFPVFIMRDDMPQVIPQIRQLRPRWNLLSHTPRVLLKGFVYGDFESRPLEERRLHTIDLIINLELLRRANFVICTHSTNICRFLALLRDPRWPLSSMLSLDGEWSPMK